MRTSRFSRDRVAGALRSARIAATTIHAPSDWQLGHAAFLGKPRETMENVKEAPIGMTLPMLILAGFCMLFGLYNQLPIDSILVPALPMHEIAARSGATGGHAFSGILPHDWFFAGMACVALAIAFINHLVGVKRSGSGLGAVDHIHHAPALGSVYAQAEAGRLDPYRWGMGFVQAFAYIGNAMDWINDQIFESLAVGLTALLSWSFRKVNTGSYALYVLWSLAGVAALIWFLLS